jgi:hypothetical protein
MSLIKTPSGLTHGLPPEGLQPHLRVQLKKEWRFDPDKGAFHDLSGKRKGYVTPRLPPDSRVVTMVPALAEADPRKLSKEELKLARFIYIMLPEAAKSEKILKEVREWPFVESAEPPRFISLPQ